MDLMSTCRCSEGRTTPTQVLMMVGFALVCKWAYRASGWLLALRAGRVSCLLPLLVSSH